VAILTRSKAIEIGIRSAIEFFYFDDIGALAQSNPQFKA
jgi:hypothetical protein